MRVEFRTLEDELITVRTEQDGCDLTEVILCEDSIFIRVSIDRANQMAVYRLAVVSEISWGMKAA